MLVWTGEFRSYWIQDTREVFSPLQFQQYIFENNGIELVTIASERQNSQFLMWFTNIWPHWLWDLWSTCSMFSEAKTYVQYPTRLNYKDKRVSMFSFL